MADEYIKRFELHDLVNNDTSFGLYKEDDSGCDVAFSISEVHKMIDIIPSADVVEVVRCKDCKYAHMTYDGKCKYCDTWNGEEDPLYLDGDFYCGFGDRKDGGT